MNRRTIAEQIFLAGVESVLPDKLIVATVTLTDNCLLIGKQRFSLDTIGKIYVLGAGNASACMASELEKILGSRIAEGHVVVKYGYSCKLKFIKVTEAGHPFADSNVYKATKAVLKIAEKANEDDLVICLISGGASELLPDFPEGSSPEEMISYNNLLLNSGACIKEITAVRKHVSMVKGGQFARAIFPAALITLILSDVPGDHIDIIASGPTTPDLTTFQNALAVLEKYNLMKSVSGGIIKHLKEGENGNRPETPKPADPVFAKTCNILIGNNIKALEAAKCKASEYGFKPIVANYQLQGDINTVAEYLVETALKFKNNKCEVKPVCLLFGGDVAVKITGKGYGGRNQHLSLLSAILLADNPGITILSAATDGIDGLTDAAGAVVDSDTVTDALSKNIDPSKFLKAFDSYHFFKKVNGHVITGPSKTNVGDLIVVIVD